MAIMESIPCPYPGEYCDVCETGWGHFKIVQTHCACGNKLDYEGGGLVAGKHVCLACVIVAEQMDPYSSWRNQ